MASELHLQILGCYAAAPNSVKNPTAQVLTIKNHVFLIDCGEGTQVALRRNKVRFSRISHIFISHLHGDHIFGLIGLIMTFSLLKREKPLTVHGPVGIKEICLLQLKLSKGYTSYPLQFNELDSKVPTLVFEDDKVKVTTIPLKHRIYTNGFYFEEKLGLRTLNVESAESFEIDKVYFNKIKQGADMTLEDGRTIKNELLTSDPPEPKKYAYCSDTSYKESIVKQIYEATVLYHEATFLDSHEHLCKMTGHSTAKQAAMIAKKAKVGRLILGHYSTRYESIDLFKQEAQTIFEKVLLADDGISFTF